MDDYLRGYKDGLAARAGRAKRVVPVCGLTDESIKAGLDVFGDIEGMTTREIAAALDIDPGVKKISRNTRKIGFVLRGLGYRQKQKRLGRMQRWIWITP